MQGCNEKPGACRRAFWFTPGDTQVSYLWISTVDRRFGEWYTDDTWEANWSFANLVSDFWLAKIGYDIVWQSGFWYYRPWCSSPAQILTGYGVCP